MNFIKKTTQNIRAKITKFQVSKDDEFDELHDQYKESRKNAPRIEQHLRDLDSHVNAISKTIEALADDFSKEYSSEDVIRQYISQMYQLSKDFQSKGAEEFSASIENRCLSQIKNYTTALDTAAKSIENRESTKYSYDNARYKVQQLLESKKPVPPTSFMGAQQELANYTTLYNQAAFQTKKELHGLVNSRAHNPTLVAFLDSFSRLTATMAQMFSQPFTEYSHKISQLPMYHEEYKGSQQTVNPEELHAHIPEPPQPTTATTDPYAYAGPNVSSGFNPTNPTIPVQFQTEWYYLDGKVQQKGPIDFPGLKQLYRSREISDTTHVFGGDLTDWKPISAVPELKNVLAL